MFLWITKKKKNLIYGIAATGDLKKSGFSCTKTVCYAAWYCKLDFITLF